MRSGKMRMPEKRLSMRWRMSPVRTQASLRALSIMTLVVRSASCSVCMASRASGDECADLGCACDDVLGELGVALLGHGAAADCAFGDGFFDFAEFLLHLGIDFSANFAACGGEQGEDGDVFGEVVADGAAGVCHGCHAEPLGDAVLDV